MTGSLQQSRVLISDPYEHDRYFIQQTLASAFTVQCVDTIAETITACTQEDTQPKILVINLHQRNSDAQIDPFGGFAIIRMLLQDYPHDLVFLRDYRRAYKVDFQPPSIVVLTWVTNLTAKKTAFEAGVDGYFLKPHDKRAYEEWHETFPRHLISLRHSQKSTWRSLFLDQSDMQEEQ